MKFIGGLPINWGPLWKHIHTKKGKDVTRQALQLCWQVLGTMAGRILQFAPNRFCKRHFGFFWGLLFFSLETNVTPFTNVPVGRQAHTYLQRESGRFPASLVSCWRTPLRPSPTHSSGTNLRGCHSFRSCCGSWWCWNPVTGCVAIY